MHLGSVVSSLFLLAVLLGPVTGQVLVRKNELTVKVGRTVYLNRDDLVFRRPRRGDGCRVEVVENDPITQRVGQLEPKIFDCEFLPDTVKYIHSGSPFLSADQVKLRVHRFTHSRTLSQTFYLDIKIINATTDIIVTRGLRHVIVPEFEGLSNTVDASVIRFHHSRSSNVSCTVGFTRYQSDWPLVGQMVMGEQRTPIESVKKNCHEFLYMDIHYQHLQSPTPSVDYLPLSVELYDPANGDEVVIERFFLPIYIKNALRNSAPRSSFMSMYMMDVDQFVLSTIIPGIISAEDYETPPSKLVYNISKGLGEGEGYFVSLDDHTMPITSFLQDDLENHRIAYQTPNISFSERKIYEVEFTVFDSHFERSIPIVLHIAVRTSSTDAPKVSYNTGLIILEGQSRSITTDNLQIVDSDNIDRVRLYVTGGLQNGQLLLASRPVLYFTVSDLRSGRLKYIHDDSETTRDQINLRINDGSSNVMVTFPIQIIPKDDSPPYIVNNVGMELNEGETQRIRDNMLLAHDTDSVDNNIVYSIAQPTSAGEVIRKLRPGDTGTRVNKFTQRDLLKGYIFYRHFGHEDFQDQFKFTLRDNQEPPNESVMETFFIVINPVNENPPQLSPEATRLMHVAETDIALITKSELEYTDVETDANQLTYIITSPPYFVYNTGRNMADAGKIIATHNMTMVMKDSSHPAETTFKQEDINHVKIGYMPPIQDIGPEARLVRFVYTVQDSSGNKVLGQQFDIDVQPVNNQVPQFITTKLLVEEGGILGISTNQLSATDEDTHTEDLVFIIEELPSYGAIQKAGVNLQDRDTFTMLDLRRQDLRYIHDGSEVLIDMFTLTLTDGENRISKTVSIDIVPIDDEAPRVRNNLRPNLIVSEGSQTTISTNVLAATDEDTDDGRLVFLIVKQPKYGILQLNGQPTTKFTQQNVKDGEVVYLHSSGEIGSHAIKDSATFIVSDQNFMATADLPVFLLNVTITPVDNQRPTIIAGSPIIVGEGMHFTFSPDILTAKDPDTEPESIEFVITRQPQWGYLENIKPSLGSEKSNAGVMISSFKLQDIIDQSINYVQATHKGVEPTADSFEFYASDGNLNSPDQSVEIAIEPVNDEEPDVMLNDFSVHEGGSMIIDRSMVDAIDMDEPKDPITLSISQPPEHGDIVIMLHTKNGDVEASVHDFSSDELHSGMKLKYKHDNSENFRDKFALTVSDGKHEVKRLCNITVEPMNDARPEITKNAGLQLQYGDHALISSVVLESMDDDNTKDELFYILVAVPRKGSLQYCLDPFSPTYTSQCTNLQVGMNFTQQDIDDNHIRYVHTTSMGTSETDSFLFVLTDGENKRHVETFEIRIMNSKRRTNIALLNRGLNIREGERVTLTTNDLSASDESTRAEEIVFAVIRAPVLGQLEYIDRPLVSISSFTQLDLASSKIVYNHLTKTDFTSDSFTFTVTNGLSDAKDGEFIINIEPLDKILPTLHTNTLVEVLQGMEVTLTSLHLRAEDPDTASSNVTYLIAKAPAYGHLYNRGVFITSLFTQNEIDRGFITYESSDSYTGLDNFLFRVSDGRHEGFLVNGTLQRQPAMCSIFIKPLINDAPKLLTSQQPESLERFDDGRYGFYLNSRNLKAVDSDTVNTHLVYYLEQRPRHGHIENSEAKRYVRRRFTQMDLDDNVLQYVVDTKDESTNDSFTFSIRDSRGNTLEGQKFSLQWSSIEFVKTELVVCENTGTLTLTLTRRGNLNSLAFVGIEVRDISTVKDIDYIPSTAAQVQFEPGMTTASWDVEIIDDDLEENNEKFRVFLLEPVNAILGHKRKASIRLINAIGEECPEYLGIIGKHQLEFPELEVTDRVQPDASETIILDHEFKRVDDPYSNTYNTDPKVTDVKGDGRTAELTDISQETTVTQNKSPLLAPSKSKEKKRRRKGKKAKKSKRRNKKARGRSMEMGLNENTRRRTVSSGEEEDELPVNNMHQLQTVDIQAPQHCTSTTRGLLYFDMGTQQMYKCNGLAWQAWSPVSNQDQQPETQECQQGWSKFSGRCYKFVNERLTWEVAETLCQMSYEAHLTTVTSKKHLQWLTKLSGKKSYWIGLNDKSETGVWMYTNGEALSYSKWSQGGPRVKRMLHKKNCVLVNKKGQWKNKICDNPKGRLVCEKGTGTDKGRSPPKRHVNGGRSRYTSNEQDYWGFFFGRGTSA